MNNEYKVIGVDNFGRDHISEICASGDEPISREEAQRQADALNAKGGEYAPYFYKVVPFSKPLFVWEP